MLVFLRSFQKGKGREFITATVTVTTAVFVDDDDDDYGFGPGGGITHQGAAPDRGTKSDVYYCPGARFTKYLTIYHKTISSLS